MSKKVETEIIEKVGTENSEELERGVKKKNIVNTTPTGCGAAEPEARPLVEVYRSAMDEHPSIRDTLFNDPEDEYELEVRSVLNEKVISFLTDPQYNTHSARGQSISTSDVFSKKIMENAVKLTCSFMASEARRHISCSDLMFYS